MSERRKKLEAMLETNPRDSFLLYGLAMEHLKEGNSEEGILRLKIVTEIDPDYTAAFFQLGQVLSQAGATDEARTWLEQGIAAARKTGDAHAASEMEQYLMLLG